jgi:hypothetical protein
VNSVTTGCQAQRGQGILGQKKREERQWRSEVKVKIVPFHAMKAYIGSRGMAPLILNLGT